MYSYPSVDHKTDESKTDGLVYSSHTAEVSVVDSAGNPTGDKTVARICVVMWPDRPDLPAMMDELAEDLIFESIYCPSQDDEDEDDSTDTEIVNMLADENPELYNELLARTTDAEEAEGEVFEDENGEAEEEEEDEEN